MFFSMIGFVRLAPDKRLLFPTDIDANLHKPVPSQRPCKKLLEVKKSLLSSQFNRAVKHLICWLFQVSVHQKRVSKGRKGLRREEEESFEGRKTGCVADRLKL